MIEITNTARTKLYQMLQLFLFSVLIIFPTMTAHADIGPKPSMEFVFKHETDAPFEILDGIQLECDSPDCLDEAPLEEMGPQRFTCDQNSCSSLAYGYSEYHRLQIRFRDGKTLESNIFTTSSFSTTFRVIIREDDLVVEKIRGRSNPMGWMFVGSIFLGIAAILLGIAFLILVVLIILRAGENKADLQNSRTVFVFLWFVMGALMIFGSFFSLAIPFTIVLEALLALLYAHLLKRPKLLTVTLVVLVNLITLPMLWMSAIVIVDIFSTLIVFEIIIWLVESLFLYLTQRKTVAFREMLLLSFVLNLVSFLLGLFLPI